MSEMSPGTLVEANFWGAGPRKFSIVADRNSWHEVRAGQIGIVVKATFYKETLECYHVLFDDVVVSLDPWYIDELKNEV